MLSRGSPFSTRETTLGSTFASAATSRNVGFRTGAVDPVSVVT
jgi:hypothetical protein